MAALDRMRRGDTIIDRNMRHQYHVTHVGFDEAVAARADNPARTRSFRADSLEEVDEGLWQEMAN